MINNMIHSGVTEFECIHVGKIDICLFGDTCQKGRNKNKPVAATSEYLFLARHKLTVDLIIVVFSLVLFTFLCIQVFLQ